MAKTKIATDTIVKEVKTKKGGAEVKFGKLHFSGGQVEKLSALAEEEAKVTLTIEPVQDNLPGTV